VAINANELSIINEAFNQMGIRRIVAADLTTPSNRQSELAVDSYEHHRRTLLRDHPWNFARYRTTLTAEIATSPAWGYTFWFVIPDGVTPAGEPECVRMLQINQDQLVDYTLGNFYRYEGANRWKVEGQKILSDVGDTIDVLYTQHIADSTLMDDMFKELLSAKLAVEWSMALLGSNEIRDRLERDWALKLREFRSIDSQEGTPDPMITGDWLMSRF